jgi:hypothetical protein
MTLLSVGATQRAAKSTPSRPRMPSTSAWAKALLVPPSPQLYSVKAIFVPGKRFAIQALRRGMSITATPFGELSLIHDSSM